MFLWGVLCYTKGFTSPAEFGNGGDLIGGLVTGSTDVQWLPPGLEDKRGETREVDTVLHYSLRRKEGGGGSVESPCNTWGPLLKLQETKEAFSQSLLGKNDCQNVQYGLKRFLLHSRQLILTTYH